MKKLALFCIALLSLAARAQEEPDKDEKDKFLPKGNDAFQDKKYNEAEADYRVSQSKFPKKSDASYNLGNSIYRQKQNAEAKAAYLNAIKNAATRPEKHRAYHNLGNVYMAQKDYQAAVSAYKNALINNPSDEQTRYNYALAKKMLKDNPPPKSDKNQKDKDKNKDKKDDKKDQDKNQDKNQDKKDDQKKNDKKDNQGQQDKDKNQGDQNQPKPQPRPGGISGQRMENMLDAVNNEEKKIQDKVKARQQKGKPVQTDKDW